MATPLADTILRCVQSLVASDTSGELTDAQLLQRFTTRREEAAFATLVQRHGGLVWGVCQHILHHEQDAEDAFQATFLVLARRAGAIHKREAVSSFLYGTAYRIARKARRCIRRRQERERRAALPASEPPADLAWRELQARLDEEVQGLPEKYRAPFVLCCLEGRSRQEAAQYLGCKEGTISSRIARARQRLQRRLARRGITLSAALCAALFWKQTAAARVPAVLVHNTIAAAGVAGKPSAAALALADGIAHGVGLAPWHVGGVLLLGLSLLAVGVAAKTQSGVSSPPQAGSQDNSPATSAPSRKDRHGDPLPPGALARLGTLRQRAPDSHLAVSADGKEVIALSTALTLRRFDARTGELRAMVQLSGGTSDLFRYQSWLSPHGAYALASGVSGPGNYFLDVWDLTQGKVRHTLSLAEPTWGAAFSADERRLALAVSSEQSTHQVLLWDPAASRPRTLWSQKKVISSRYFEPVLAFSPDGKRLLSCHLDRILRCWDTHSGKLLWQSEKEGWSPFILFSPDGRTVLTPSGIGVSGLTVRDAATGKVLPGAKQPPREAVFPIGYSPDGRFLALQTDLEEVVLWEPGKETVAFRFPRPPHHRGAVLFNPNRLPTNFAFTPDGKGFLRRAGALQRWDLATGKAVYKDTEAWGHTEDVTRLVFSPDGRLLASSSKDATARLWDMASGRTLHTVPCASSHLVFTPDGRSLLTVPFGLGKTVLEATDGATGRPQRGFELADRSEFMTSAGEREIRITPDGKKVLMLTWKNGRRDDESMLTAWSLETGACLVHKRVPWGEESLLAPDGRSVLAADSRARAVKLLALDTATPRWQLRLDRDRDARRMGWRCDLALSPNGRLMAARSRFLDLMTFQSEDDALRLGSLTTGRQLHKVTAEGPLVFAFSADSRFLAVAGRDVLRIWETVTGKEVGSLPAPHRGVRPPEHACASALAFSPDGRTLATGHADGSILLWDATLRGGAHGGPLSDTQRQALWADLAGADAARAQSAVWRLVDDPKPSLSFLKERLRPVPPVPPEVARSLLDELDSDRFDVREAALRKLRALGERVEAALRQELKARPALETQRRIEALLGQLEVSPLSAEDVRAERAVQILERIGSAEARKILEDLGRGTEFARLTRAAKEALARLAPQ